MNLDFMRDKRKSMPEIVRPEKVKSIRIWHCNYESIDEIKRCKNLEELVVATLPEKNFEFLKNLTSLKYLAIIHLPKITSLDGLDVLMKLEVLSLSTLPSWDASGKITVVSSMEVLSMLKNLKHIELFGVLPETMSLSALKKCRNLVSARFSKYPKKVVQEFYKTTGIEDDWAPEAKFLA